MIKDCPICGLKLVKVTINSRIKYHCTDSIQHHFYLDIESNSENKIESLYILYNKYYITWELLESKKLTVSLPINHLDYWKLIVNYVEPDFADLKNQLDMIIDKYNLVAVFK